LREMGEEDLLEEDSEEPERPVTSPPTKVPEGQKEMTPIERVCAAADAALFPSDSKLPLMVISSPSRPATCGAEVQRSSVGRQRGAQTLARPARLGRQHGPSQVNSQASMSAGPSMDSVGTLLCASDLPSSGHFRPEFDQEMPVDGNAESDLAGAEDSELVAELPAKQQTQFLTLQRMLGFDVSHVDHMGIMQDIYCQDYSMDLCRGVTQMKHELKAQVQTQLPRPSTAPEWQPQWPVKKPLQPRAIPVVAPNPPDLHHTRPSQRPQTADTVQVSDATDLLLAGDVSEQGLKDNNNNNNNNNNNKYKNTESWRASLQSRSDVRARSPQLVRHTNSRTMHGSASSSKASHAELLAQRLAALKSYHPWGYVPPEVCKHLEQLDSVDDEVRKHFLDVVGPGASAQRARVLECLDPLVQRIASAQGQQLLHKGVMSLREMS
ncbi:unnamed protein product, partial [Polarella glacialis]